MPETVAAQLYALLELLLIDLVFVAILLLGIVGLAYSKRAAFAVMKRNFTGYFTNPTGYVFLCLFVLLTSMAAFWPHEFFSSNLATLDQLNKWFPVIMLFFIPAITMSIWADERRQGTDELLLTLPANDFDIVIGKYLATASIYTTSLIFSQFSTFFVLMLLSKGQLDTGLFAANYFGYWFIGMAMLAIGMIASFLTSNLTVGFILGALFNAPLAFASMADVVIQNGTVARFVRNFSIREQFDSFGRGVVSISAVAFFVLVVAFGLYLCMVLIGRRHWSGGKDGNTMFLHYFGRVVMLVAIVLSASYFFRNNDRIRTDLTKGQVSSLSATTRKLILELEPKHPIVIDAYLSGDVPEQYARTKYDLLARLKEFQSLASSRKVQLEVRINDNLEPFSEQASIAEKQYGIQPQTIRVRERGQFVDQKVLLGAAFRCGLSKVVVPFFENGVPVEYELVRSITTVAAPAKKKLGVVRTDAQFMGGFSMAGGGFQQIGRQPILEELSKQYELVEVDPAAPISTDQYDVLMVVQPSSLGPQELPNVINALKEGVPTAIFEDPVPFGFETRFPGTGEPKQAPGGMFGGGGPVPKGDIQELWKAIGVRVPNKPSMGGSDPFIVWQAYNPYPKLSRLMQATNEWIFVREEAAADNEDLLSEKSPITAGLREVMFLYAGSVEADYNDNINFTPLIRTGPNSGHVEAELARTALNRGDMESLVGKRSDVLGSQTIAALLEGKSETTGGDGQTGRPLRAVYVADADCMLGFFLNVRRRPDQFDEIRFNFQNVTFVLNVIDVLAGQVDYPAVRSHEPQHSTLQLLEEQSEIYRDRESRQRSEFTKTFNDELQNAEDENQKVLAKFQERVRKLEADGATDANKRRELLAALQEFQLRQADMERKLAVRRKQLEVKRDADIAESRRQADKEVLALQNGYKLWAIFVPPIPPLLIGIGVFVSRRVREREGISKNRLR
jgi:ABC-2 type transport system permease protein